MGCYMAGTDINGSPIGRTQSRMNNAYDRAIDRFNVTVPPLVKERALSLSDRRFIHVTGAQWEDQWQKAFENSIRVEIDKTSAGYEKIINDCRSNRVTVNFRPTDDRASEQTADTLDGMFRADLYRCKGQQAFDNAFSEGVGGGMGAWRLCNEFEDEYDPDNDYQRIAIKTIVDADQSVFFDPNSKLYDKSDAKFAFVLTSMSPGAFADEYGSDKAVSWPQGLVKPAYDWYTPEIVRVAEYYEVEIKKELHYVFSHTLTQEIEKLWASDLGEDGPDAKIAEGWQLVRSRKVKRCRIHKYIMSGAEILEDLGYIAGNCIPIVPFYGHREYVDNMERVRGHVRKAKDPQRVYNSQISKLTETAASAPIERPIFHPEQVAGLETHWAEANLNRAPYALVNPMMDADGNPMPAGPIGMISPPQLSPVLATLMQVTANDIRELTSSDDSAAQIKSNVSAEAMDIAATRTDEKSAIYMDNMRQSMQRCGEIYQSMAAEVYVEDGREVETLGADGEDGRAVLKEEYTDKATKVYGVRNDFAVGKYKVIADVTEATVTRRDKTVKTCMNAATAMAAIDPAMSKAFAITGFMNMDGEGIKDLQDWLRQQALAMGLVKPTDEERAAQEEADQNAQPDPQAQALEAMASKEGALAVKAEADTQLAKAKTVSELANAQKIAADTGKTVAETQSLGMAAMNGNV